MVKAWIQLGSAALMADALSLGQWGRPLLAKLVGSVLGSLSCFMQHRGFYTPLGRILLEEEIFPLELAWVLFPFLQNSCGWEYKPRSSLYSCAFHRMDSKEPDIHVLDGWMLGTKTPSMHQPQTECGYLNGWIKNGRIHKNLTQHGESHRCCWGTQKKKKLS